MPPPPSPRVFDPAPKGVVVRWDHSDGIKSRNLDVFTAPPSVLPAAKIFCQKICQNGQINPPHQKNGNRLYPGIDFLAVLMSLLSTHWVSPFWWRQPHLCGSHTSLNRLIRIQAVKIVLNNDFSYSNFRKIIFFLN